MEETTSPSPIAKVRSKLSGRKKMLMLVAVATTAVTLSGVGAINGGQTAIKNNQFIKDAQTPTTAFTFTGDPFNAHFNTDTKTATASWTASDTSATDTATFDGIFSPLKSTDNKGGKKKLKEQFAKHLKISYKLTEGSGGVPLTGDGGTLSEPVKLSKAFDKEKEKGIVLQPGGKDTLDVTVTWDGPDPAPAQAIKDIADFNVTYSMNPGTE